MNRELKLLNLICLLTAVGFIALVALNALFSPQLMTTDNLFVTMVCLVMAVMFGSIPLFYMKSQGKLPIPFQKRLTSSEKQFTRGTVVTQVPGSKAPPMLDAKGRALPPDVRSMVTNMKRPL
jgi:hypothetical protein